MDDGMTASELRQRYERGGSVRDSDLSAAQLRSRYAIPGNTFKEKQSDSNTMMIIAAIVVLTSIMSLFTKKDLGLLLPDDTPGDPVSLRHTTTKEETEVFKPLKPKVDPSKKVARYRAGQVPKFAHGYEEDRGFVTAHSHVRVIPAAKAQHKAAPVINTGRKRVEAQVLSSAKPTANARGRRQRSSSPSDNDKDSSDEDVAKALQDSSSEEEDSDIDRRRRMLRNKAKAREAQKEETTPVVLEKKSERQPVEPQIVKRNAVAPAMKARDGESESSGSGSSSSEYETDTDDSEPGEELMKPVFVPKKARGTVKRQEELAAEEERRQKREQEKLDDRKMESRRLVAEEIRREQDGADKDDSTDVEMPDDTDGLDPETEYRDWELREMRRIKRDRDQKELRRKEEEETLRRRNMTEEERAAEDAKLKKNEPKEKKKLKFMQKYYHKGAFYVDDDSIRTKDDVRKRDATEATLEDKFNREMLPAVMQVKNFGRAGRIATKILSLAYENVRLVCVSLLS
ncbi:Microfibrillar-associated protein 1 [Phytophthora megakarya]|uniref:Microfibrillar-associated protein 1 n=1 Tax=Phytophthora megakarya TaxID=4795 RepID=A0A225X142_9STRA|nr:Microfibrillar-associated protein 1 [Phytophthora megakarya]